MDFPVSGNSVPETGSLEIATTTNLIKKLSSSGPLNTGHGQAIGVSLAVAVPLLFGLIVVVPVPGHATQHLYRKLVPP